MSTSCANVKTLCKLSKRLAACTVCVQCISRFLHECGWMDAQGWEQGNNGFRGRALEDGGSHKELAFRIFQILPRTLPLGFTRQWQRLILTNEHQV